MLIGQGGDAAAPGGAGEEAQLHQVGLIDVLQCDGLFTDGGGQSFQANRAAAQQVSFRELQGREEDNPFADE